MDWTSRLAEAFLGQCCKKDPTLTVAKQVGGRTGLLRRVVAAHLKVIGERCLDVLRGTARPVPSHGAIMMIVLGGGTVPSSRVCRANADIRQLFAVM